MWFKFFKKEKIVTTTKATPKTTSWPGVHEVKKKLDTHDDQLSAVLNRMSQMADEIHLLKGELDRFKNDVASDVKYLTDRVS